MTKQRAATAHLLLYILERARTDHRKTDKEHIRLWIGQRPQSVVVFLAGRIEKTQCVRLATDHDRYRIVVEHRRHVLGRKLVGRVADQEARLTDGTVTHHYAFYGLHFIPSDAVLLL